MKTINEQKVVDGAQNVIIVSSKEKRRGPAFVGGVLAGGAVVGGVAAVVTNPAFASEFNLDELFGKESKSVESNVTANENNQEQPVEQPVEQPAEDPIVYQIGDIKVTIDSDIKIASEVNDDMSFNEAFAAARAEVGAGGAFIWQDKVYGTYVTEEWEAMTAEERAAYGENFAYQIVNDDPEVEGISVSACVNDEMSFEDAFAAAREDVGPGGVFVWRGQLYGTYYAEEWEAMTDEDKDSYWNSVHKVEQPVQTEETEETEQPVDPTIEIVDVARVTDVLGNEADVAIVSVNGENVALVDNDLDGIADVMVVSVNHDDVIDQNEIIDVSEEQISMADMAQEYLADNIAPEPETPYEDDNGDDDMMA